MSINSKTEEEFIEDLERSTKNEEVLNQETDEEDDFSDIDESKVLRKIDFRLLPVITLLYLLSYMDRTNIGNAYIEGLAVDLGLSVNEYALCVMVFFLFYSAFEIPSNILLKKLGKQSVFIPTIVVCWGIVMTCMGLVNNFSQLFALRVLLGIFEAGLYPGITYSLTMFYKRSDLLSRHSIFYCGASSAGAFSGLLAFAIAKMSGTGGYKGWRWIFILEGLLTVVVAVACYWLLIDYPKDCKFLTQREKDFINWRLKNDINVDYTRKIATGKDVFINSTRAKPVFTGYSDKEDVSMKAAFFSVFKSWQIYFFVLLYWGAIIPIYGLSLSAPSVVKALGYTSSKAQLMTIPIYLVASIWTVTQSFISDRFGKRSPFIIGDLIVAIIGIILMIVGQSTKHYKVVYGGLFVTALGMTSQFPTMITWCANNVTNNKRRAIAIAVQIGFGNFGGAAATYIYYSGNYLRGHYILLGFACFALFITVIMSSAFIYTNRRDVKSLENHEYDEVEDLELFRMGDKSPFFRYIL